MSELKASMTNTPRTHSLAIPEVTEIARCEMERYEKSEGSREA